MAEIQPGSTAGGELLLTTSSVKKVTKARELQKIQASDIESNDLFGYSVSMSGNGNTLIVGSRAEDTGSTDAGAAYIFENQNGTWIEAQKIQASDKASTDWFGDSVSISSDGLTCVVGARNKDSSTGAVYVFENQSGTWTEVAKLVASDAQTGDKFGDSVSISNNGLTCVVGAFGEDTGASSAGAVYVFENQAGTWNEIQKLQASTTVANDNFGYSVALSGNGLVCSIGATGDDSGGVGGSGATYIFENQNGTWVETQKIKTSILVSGSQFGNSISISFDGKKLIVGADLSSNTGAAYIFENNNGTWIQVAKLQSYDLSPGDWFGTSVSISNDGLTCIVGAYGQPTNGIDAGAAYVFTFNGEEWLQQQKIISSDAESYDYFGWSTALSHDGLNCVVSAYQEDTGGTAAGAVYIYEIINKGY